MDNTMLNTQQLMVSTLNQIGCQPTVNHDDTVSVTYQGEDFYIDFGGTYAQIWDLGWLDINVDDPSLSQVREAINNTNFTFGPTVVLTAPDEEGKIYFHSKLDIFLHPSIPEVESYVRASLDIFFRTKEAFRRNFQRITDER